MKINIEELNKNKEKARIYQTEEELNFNNIKEVLENKNYYYNTKNNKKLSEIENELINKLNVIKNMHQTNIAVIEKIINKYKDINQKTEKIFDDLTER